MATPVSNTPRVAAHYADVVELNADLVEALRALPVQPQGADLPPEYLILLGALVDQYAMASIGMSADYYQDLRDLAGVVAPFTTPIVDPPDQAAIEAAVLSALAEAGLTPGDLGVDVTDLQGIDDAIQNLIEGLTKTLVMEAGRDEVWTALENDVAAKGWARVTRANACAFCRMLATRGAVYKTERSASFQAHTAGPNGGGDCQCTVEPLFAKTYEPPAHTRADQVLWSEVTDGVPSSGPVNKLNEFRRAIEGRSNGPRRRQRTRAGR